MFVPGCYLCNEHSNANHKIHNQTKMHVSAEYHLFHYALYSSEIDEVMICLLPSSLVVAN